MSDTPATKKRLSPTFVVILMILGLIVAFALYLILNAEHIKLTGNVPSCSAWLATLGVQWTPDSGSVCMSDTSGPALLTSLVRFV